MSSAVVRLGPADIDRVRALNRMFGKAFEDPDSYAKGPPGDSYFHRILGRDEVIALAAIEDDDVIGGLVAYVLPKLEQERSEIYIYDLAVSREHRRRGIATALIAELQRLAGQIGAWVVYVQADYGDDAAIALYTGLGRREDVMHFDIAPRTTT